MIQLTEICYDLDGNPYERIIIVPDSILVKDVISNRIGGGKSIVIVPGIGKYEVKETHNEVALKVLEWRLAMERYKALAKALASASENLNAYNNELDEEEKTLLVLAGLEGRA